MTTLGETFTPALEPSYLVMDLLFSLNSRLGYYSLTFTNETLEYPLHYSSQDRQRYVNFKLLSVMFCKVRKDTPVEVISRSARLHLDVGNYQLK